MLIMEKQEKKTPTVEQVMEYRTWFDNLTDEAMAKISAFEREYNVFTHVYEEKGGYGVKDICGEVLIPAMFDKIACVFSDEYRNWAVPVVKDGMMALVASDGKGTLLTPLEYDNIHFYLGYYYLFKDGKEGLACVDGNILVPAEMDEVYAPFNSLVAFAKDGKYGFTMMGTGVITEPIYDEHELDESDTLVVVKDGVRGYLDENGAFTLDRDESFFNANCW